MLPVMRRRERTVDELRDIMTGMIATLENLGYDPRQCTACEWVDGAGEESTVWTECHKSCGAIFCHFCLDNSSVKEGENVLCWKCGPDTSTSQPQKRRRKGETEEKVADVADVGEAKTESSDDEVEDVGAILKIIQGRGFAFGLYDLGKAKSAEFNLGQAAELLREKNAELGLKFAWYVFHLDGQSWFWLTGDDLYLACRMCQRKSTVPTTSFTVFRSNDAELDRMKLLATAIGLDASYVGFWTWIGAVNYPEPAPFNPKLEMQDFDQWSDSDPEVEELLERDY